MILAAAPTLPTPSIEYHLVAPMLIVFGAAVAGVLIEAFGPRRIRYPAQLLLTVAALIAAFVMTVLLAGTRRTALSGAVTVDGPALFLQGTILLVALLAVGLLAARSPAQQRRSLGAAAAPVTHRSITLVSDTFTASAATVPGSTAEGETTAAGLVITEVFPLALLAVGGMMLFPAANDLLTMFVALEVLSLPLYLLCGLARRRRLLSQEAALKYFLLGAFSSAFFLYGIALLYGYAGTVGLPGIAHAIADHRSGQMIPLLGTALLTVGLLFKIGAVPFHSWVPDVYQGAPTPITGLMAAATKITAFGALLRILLVGLDGLRTEWRPLLWVVAIVTMVAGCVIAVTQTDVKRMLAYSAIAHAGFMLTGVIADNRDGVGSVLFYLVAYAFSTLGAFAVVAMVRDGDGEAGDLGRWAGVGRRHPVLGAAFALFLLAFAGIPLTSGFVSKFAVFHAAAATGGTPLVIVGVVCSAIAAFFYVRIIVAMFFARPDDLAPPVIAAPNPLTYVVVGVGAVVTLVLGIVPAPLLDLADRAADFLR